MLNNLKLLKLFLIFLIIISIQGCLHFNTSSYRITLNSPDSGSVEVVVKDINTDASDNTKLKEDQHNLFEFALKSKDFVRRMESEGKFITDRKLFLDEGKLNAIVNYDFKNINDVEGIVYEEPFYYLTLEQGDSVVSTNGKIIVSKDYKRILWDDSIDTLKFEMFSEDTDAGNLTSMAAYFNKE